MTKPAKRAIGGKPNRRAAGQPPDVAPMVGDGMAGSPRAIIRETRQCWLGASGKQSARLAGGSQSVRSSEEAGNDRGAKGRRKVAVWGFDPEFLRRGPDEPRWQPIDLRGPGE
jgi:hypothetical protein